MGVAWSCEMAYYCLFCPPLTVVSIEVCVESVLTFSHILHFLHSFWYTALLVLQVAVAQILKARLVGVLRMVMPNWICLQVRQYL